MLKLTTQLVLDITDLPEPVKTKMYDAYRDYVGSNDSYFRLYLQEYREYVQAGDDYGAHYSQAQTDVLQWLCAHTTADELLVLYWW